MNADYMTVLKSDEQEYDAYVVLEDNTIVDTDISSLKIIYNMGEKLIGNFATKMVEFTLFNTGNYNITNQEFEVFIGLKVNSEFEYRSIGKFIADKPVLKDDTQDEYTIKAHNYYLKFKTKYEPILTFPTTIGNAISTICNHLEISFIDSNFINKDYVLNDFFVDDDATFFDVIKILVEASFANAIINNQNTLIIKNPSAIADYTFSLNELFDLKKEDNRFGPLNSIVASRIVADDGSTTEDVFAKDDESILENGLYEYKILQNQAIDYDRQTAVDNILSGMLNFSYVPAKIETVFNPYTEIGDMLEVPDKNTETSFLLFAKEINIDVSSGLMKIESTEKSKTETNYKSATVKEKRKRTEAEVNKLKGKISLVVEETEELSDKIAQIELDAASITQRVSRTEDAVDVLMDDSILTSTTDYSKSHTITDAMSGKIKGMSFRGLTTQEGIPSPGSPAEFVNVSGDVNISVINSDYSQEQNILLPLGLTEYCSQDDVSDEIVKIDGVWNRIQKIIRLILTGNETIYNSGHNATTYHWTIRPVDKKFGQTNMLSNNFKVSIDSTLPNTIVGNASNTNITFKMPLAYSTIVLFKEFLTEKYNLGAPVIVQYELEDPIYTPIENEELINALDSMFETYEECTHVDSGMLIKFEYYRNTPTNKEYVPAQEKVLEEIAGIKITNNSIESSVKEVVGKIQDGSLVSKETFEARIQEASTQWSASFSEITDTLDGGVPKVKTGTTTIDATGIHVGGSELQYSTNMTPESFEILYGSEKKLYLEKELAVIPKVKSDVAIIAGIKHVKENVGGVIHHRQYVIGD